MRLHKPCSFSTGILKLVFKIHTEDEEKYCGSYVFAFECNTFLSIPYNLSFIYWHTSTLSSLILFSIREARISLRSEGKRALLTKLNFKCIDFSKVPRSLLLKMSVECRHSSCTLLYFESGHQNMDPRLGRCAKNQNGNLRWHLPLGVRPFCN